MLYGDWQVLKRSGMHASSQVPLSSRRSIALLRQHLDQDMSTEIRT